MKNYQEKLFSLGADIDQLSELAAKYPMRISSHYLNLIKDKDDAIWKQAVASVEELNDDGLADPLNEDHNGELKCIVHRYADRALFYSTCECAMYCRFCTRKRKIGKEDKVTQEDWEKGFEYIRVHSEIRDVIISGGDPLTLSDTQLEYIVSSIRAIKHVQIIRIGTRMPVVNPKRVTPKLADMLKKHHPLYINTHFNHPDEITTESAAACDMLSNAGIPLGNQSVLLKGVNDDVEIMRTLVQKLLCIRVKPYYIYMMDLVQGASHFRTSLQKGLDIIQGLRGYTSGMAVPHLIVDAPMGGGKIAIQPDGIMEIQENNQVKLKNYEGDYFYYPLN